MTIKSYPFSCDHIGFNIKFKTKTEKLLHHNKFEPECKVEKNSLIDLISKFKNNINMVVKLNKLNLSEIEKMDEYGKLKVEYDEAYQKIYDKEYFSLNLREKI